MALRLRASPLNGAPQRQPKPQHPFVRHRPHGLAGHSVRFRQAPAVGPVCRKHLVALLGRPHRWELLQRRPKAALSKMMVVPGHSAQRPVAESSVVLQRRNQVHALRMALLWDAPLRELCCMLWRVPRVQKMSFAS
ncbi:MAG: hypothetical protein ACJAZO_001232 [Myxococcota bacterium]|jgi:hypothetical protein